MKKIISFVTLLIFCPLLTWAGDSVTASSTILAPTADNQYFSNNVASPPVDINGDGIDDFIIGDYYYNSNTGAVYIYFGNSSTGLSTTADITITGAAEGDYFGLKVLTYPDVSGDGVRELIVSANGTDNGTVYFYASETIAANSTLLTTDADAVLNGDATNGVNLGVDVDVYEGDNNYLIIGDNQYGSTGVGISYFYSNYDVARMFSSGGTHTPDSSYTFALYGETDSDALGNGSYAWAAGGYFALRVDSYDSNKGKLYLLNETVLSSLIGTYAINTKASVTITGTVEDEKIGGLIQDVGQGEFLALVSEPYSSNQGRILFVKKSSLDATTALTADQADIIMYGAGEENGYFGSDIRTVQDDYIAIGEKGYSSNTGRAFLIKISTLSGLTGSVYANSNAEAVISGSASSLLGARIMPFNEDLDNDNINEIILAAPDGSTVAGRVSIINSATWINATEQSVLTADQVDYYAISENTGGGFGWTLSADADFDNNGDVDLVVGEIYYNENKGQFHVYNNLENTAGYYENLMALGRSGGRITVKQVEERAESLSDTYTRNYDSYSKNMHVVFGDVDNDSSQEVITVKGQKSQCHSINIYSSSSNTKEKKFDVCHPRSQSTKAYVASANVNGKGGDEIIIAYPSADSGAYIQIYRRKTNGNYKKIAEKFILHTINFSQGLSLTAGNIKGTTKEQIAIAALEDSEELVVYRLKSTSQIMEVASRTITTKSRGLKLAIDDSARLLYVLRDGTKKIRAYRYANKKMLRSTAYDFTVDFNPKNIAANNNIIGLTTNNKKTVKLYYLGVYKNEVSYSRIVNSIDLADR